jgi:glycolate oxidase FAD binding subunit
LASVAEQSLSGLAAIAGEENVVSDPSVCAAYAVDGSAPRWVVYPHRAEITAATLQYAAARELAVIPCRNATKLATGNPPRRYDIALCLKELNQVRHYEPDDLTVSVEPGIELGEFERLLGQRQLWIPLDPPGGFRASIGGVVTTNSAGSLRLKYGAPRDMVVGMKIATTSGKIIKTGGRVVKNVAGYDLAKLMIGSYGTLGIIVEINFKLYPVPARRATWTFQVSTLDAARDFRRRILNSPLSPMRMVLLDPGALAIARAEMRESGFEIWLEFGGSERVINRSIETVQDISKACGITAGALEDSRAEAGWNGISDFRTAAGSCPEPVILKANLPISATEDFLEFAQKEARKTGLPLACFCQNGVGIVHVCLLSQDPFTGRSAVPPPEDGTGGEGRTGDIATLVARLRQAAAGTGGSLVIVRGPTDLKKQIDVWGGPGDGFDLMRKLKELWDPKGILSPGRFVGGL